MADIKLRERKKGTIKTIKKDLSKVKNNIISVKDKTKDNYENNYNTGTEYATNKISETMYNTPNNIYRANKIGRNSFKETQENINLYKKKSKIKKRAKNISKIRKNISKTAKTTIKTADKTVKGVKRTAKTTVKTSKKVVQTLKATAKATATAIKATVKATIATVKAIIAGTKALIAAIAAGRLGCCCSYSCYMFSSIIMQFNIWYILFK